MPPKKVQTKPKATKNKKVDPESEEEEEEQVTTKSKRSTSSASTKAAAAKNSKAKPAPKTSKAKAAPKGKAAAAKGKGKGKKQEESEDEEEEEEEEEEQEEEEEEKPKRGRGAAAAKGKGKKDDTKTKLQAKKDTKAKGKSKKEESEEEEEEGDMEEEEEKKDTKKGGAKNAKRGRGKSQDKDLEDEAEEEEKPSKGLKKLKTLDVGNLEVQVDDYCPQKANVEVYIKDNKKIYDAKLNQSNVDANNNKFYIIQVLRHKTNKTQFYVYNRWGRVGVKGQDKFMGPISEDKAIKEYDTKLHEKSVKGDYRILELDYTKEVPEEEKAEKLKASSKTTGLKKPVADFINLIFDTKMATKQMESIGYDAKKLPLGKLSKNNIEKGYTILNDILNTIQKRAKGDLSKLSNDFYSYIPHDVGFSKMSEFILDNEEKVKQKLELLDSLRNVKTTYELIEQKADVDNVIDANYKKLKCNIDPVERGSKDFKMIEQFIDNTKENSRVSILNIYKIERDGEYDRYTKNIDNKILLWHGSRLANFVGILSQGLRIAPPEAPASGYRFGKGIYLADMFSKSHGYCASYGSDGVFCIMLCEGACGNFNELLHDDFNASSLPKGKHSTKALGHNAPPESSYHEFEKGVKIPLGKPAKTKHQNSSCYHNEFIIYDVKQVRIRYLIWMKDDRY